MRAPERRFGEHTQAGLGRVTMVDQGHTALPARPVQVREARTSRTAASSDAEKIAGRIVEYGTPVEDANWSML